MRFRVGLTDNIKSERAPRRASGHFGTIPAHCTRMRNELSSRLWTIGCGGLLLAFLAGCAPANREELAKQVLAQDPSFKAVLDKRKTLVNRIETYEQELALKRSTADRTIKQLRRDLIEAKATVDKRITHIKSRMEPDRTRLNLAVSKAGEELKVKRAQRSSVGRQIAQLRKSLKGADVVPADQTQRQGSLDELVDDAERIDAELEALREHLRLLKIKLLLVRL